MKIRSLVLTTKQKLPPVELTGVAPIYDRNRGLETSSMISFKQRMEAAEISEKAAKHMKNAVMTSTQARNNSVWNKWFIWCLQRQINLSFLMLCKIC